MVTKGNMLIGAVILAAAYFIFLSPGFFASGNTYVQSVSFPSGGYNGKAAYLISLLGPSSTSGGPEGLIATIDQSSFSSWNANDNVQIGIFKANQTLTYSLTERSGASRNINTLQLSASCEGVPVPLTGCGALNKPWASYPGTANWDKFRNWCPTQGGGTGIPFNTGTTGYDHFRCYVPTAAFIIGDFDRVGQVYNPAITVSANTYAKGTQPWIDNSDFKKISSLELTNANPTSAIITDTGENIGQATITSLAPTFTTPPPASGVKAVSPVLSGTNRNWQLVDASIDQNYQLAVAGASGNSLNFCINQGASGGTTGYYIGPWQIGVGQQYDESRLTSCINNYNTIVQAIPANTPLTGTFALGSQIGLNTNKLNSGGYLTILNGYAYPQVQIWLYASSVGVISQQATPTSVSCDAFTTLAGKSSTVNAVVFVSAPGTVNWGFSCPSSSAVSVITPSGTATATFSNAIPFTIQVNGGQQNLASECTITATSTDGATTINGKCANTNTGVCNINIPNGCSIQPTPEDACHLNCTTPPQQCSDGTLLGVCNFAKTKRCIVQGGQNTLVDDTSCTTPPPGNQTQCIPLIQKPASTIVGGNYLGPIYLGGGTTQTNCETDYIGVALLIVGAFIILRYAGKGRR